MSFSTGLIGNSENQNENFGSLTTTSILSQSGSTSDPKVNQQINDSELIQINSTSRATDIINLNRTSPQIIISNILPGKLELNSIESYQDLIEINFVLYPNLVNNSIGNLNKELIGNDVLNLNINSTIYSNSLSTRLDQSLIGNEIIELQVQELLFQFNQEDFAYANVVFEFDNFNLILIYRNTQSFIDFGFATNSSDSIKILDPMSDILKIDIFKLTQIHNISTPNSIIALNWNVYSDKTYDFSVDFSKFSVISEFMPLIKLNNEFLDISSNPIIELIPFQEYTLSVANEIDFHEFEYIIIYHETIELENQIHFDNNLFLNSTIRFDHFYENSFIEIFLPIKLEVIFVQSIYPDMNYVNNIINFTLSELSDLTFTAIFKFESSFERISTNIQQGSLYQISEFNIKPIGGRVISSKGKTVEFYHFEDHIETKIPNNWEKGELSVILWFKDGTFHKFTEDLQYHPSKLISPTNYTLGIAERSTIIIVIQNISSQSDIDATTIYSYYQGQPRSIDTNNPLIINPGEFEIGPHILLINATFSGLVPVIFELNLYVETFNPDIKYKITRNEINNITFHFEIPEVTKWSLESYLLIQGENVSDTFEFWKEQFDIVIENENWTNSTLKFNILLILGNNIANQSLQIVAPFYYENNNSVNNQEINKKNNKTFNIISNLGIISVIASIGIISYKLIKSKYGTERINF